MYLWQFSNLSEMITDFEEEINEIIRNSLM